MQNIHSGTDFIERIKARVLDSTAVNHPYLQAFRYGDFPNVDLAFKDFAFQYGLYSTRFVSYLSALINNCSNEKHKQILQSNLAEEQGNIHDVELPPEVLESVIGQSHALLFRRFQYAMGVNANYQLKSAEFQAGRLWSQQFLKLCKTNEYVGVGAIGIGTELIVSNMYNQILEGLKAHSNLTMTQRVFFDLHSECDEEHADQMLLIAKDLAHSVEACEQIQHGVDMAIKLRTEFWDNMLEHAQNFPAAIPPHIQEEVN